ncbi:MAG: hypothetical protein VX589_07310 [Myxococcota bacterium]|nr:hypothetical protein [Myxococcota bacterium]
MSTHWLIVANMTGCLLLACASGEIEDSMGGRDGQRPATVRTPAKTDDAVDSDGATDNAGPSRPYGAERPSHQMHGEGGSTAPGPEMPPDMDNAMLDERVHGTTCQPDGVSIDTPAQPPPMRLTRLRIPITKADARSAGCEVLNSGTGGVGLARLIQLLEFSLDDIVRANADGQRPATITIGLSQWPQLPSAEQTSIPTVSIVDEQTDDRSRQNRRSDGFILHVPASTSCETISTGRGELRFQVPLLDEENVVPLTLKSTHIEGDLTFVNQGVFIHRGTINGYLHRDGIRAVLDGLNAACTTTPKPDVCNGADTLIDGNLDALMADYILPFLGGLDAEISGPDNEPRACQNSKCNALSVCIAFETHIHAGWTGTP